MAKAARIPEAQVIAAAKSDPDTFLLTTADLANAVLVIPPFSPSTAVAGAATRRE